MSVSHAQRIRRAVERVRSALKRGLSLDTCHRKLVVRAEAVPFGEERWAESYSERVTRLDLEIERGGRGDLDAEVSRRELERFESKWTPETWARRRCGECGVQVGEPHAAQCDTEQCPYCGEQRAFCPCP